MLLFGLFSYLTTVLASLTVSGTNENVWDMFHVSSPLVHELALGVVDDGKVNLL